MNISKRISWTKIVPLLLTALLVSCSLLSEKTQRSGLFRLTTSKAYLSGFSDTSSFRMISSQWDYYSSTILTKSFALVGDGNGSYSCYGASFNGSYYGGADLEWGILIRDYYNNVIFQDNSYASLGQVVNFSLPEVNTNTDGIIYRCTLYVRRKDGNYINASDMQPSVFTWYLNRTVEVPDNTMPAEWLQSTAVTTTSPFSTMTTIASDLIPDDQMIEQNLTTPPWIEGAVAQILALVSQLIQLRYIRFILGFVIIISLVAWFLH